MTTFENAPAPNAWRTDTPGPGGWARTIRPDDPNKLFVVSADCHANEPATYLHERIEPEYRDRLPRLERRDDGSEWMVTEGNGPVRVRGPAGPDGAAPAEVGSRMDDEDRKRNAAARRVADRLADQHADGVDVELIFPNKGLLCWATPDPVFAMAMCRAWNRWAHETFSPDGWHGGRTLPLASIAAGDLAGALAEVAWAAEHGVVGLCLGNSVIYGPKTPGTLEYNDPRFEPLVQLIASGVLERHPRLRVGLVESGIGFLPWLLETMDYARKAHHFFVRPQLPELPSTYFRRQCFATFQEDHVGLATIEQFDLVDNVLWANDYPHHEGSWPHSAATVEREMAHLPDDARAKILGLNAARVFDLPVTR
jgi:hypothetical protein